MQQFFIRLISIVLIGMFFGSCTPSTPGPTVEPAVEDYQLPGTMPDFYEIVVAKHDSAMLLMGDIERTQRALRGLLSTKEETTKTQILEALTALKKADDVMMTWMHEFKSTELHEEEYKTLSEAEIEAYLKEEEKKIEQVHLDMSRSVEEGEALLKKLKQ
ncbi:MAG: hypothetical protein ACRBFS_04710 [Aureispira sp.]